MAIEVQKSSLDFEALLSSPRTISSLPPLQKFEARDGEVLTYRHYPSESKTTLILVHGSGTDSQYLATLAHALAASGSAAVYTPDVRGHGSCPTRRGDIDYISQLEDDLADLIAHIGATSHSTSRIIIGGHSSGGGLAIRFAGGKHGHLAAAYLLLAPYLGHDAPTVRSNSGGWAKPSLGKIIAISILNRLGIHRFNAVKVLRFNMPDEYRNGSETLAYSYRLMTGFNPSDFRKDLKRMKAPVLVVTGAKDEAFFAGRFERVMRPLVPHADIVTVDGESHLGLVVSADTAATVCGWLQRL